MDEKKLELVSGESKEEFSVEKLRLPQDFHKMVGVQKIINMIPIKPPNRHEFIRVHPTMQLETMLLELREEQNRDTYLIAPSLWGDIPGEIVAKILLPYINKKNVLKLWSIRLPDEDGKLNPWSESALRAAEEAQKGWVRVASNMAGGFYEIFIPSGHLPDPQWPMKNIQEIINIAFRERMIDSLSHPVIEALGKRQQ